MIHLSRRYIDTLPGGKKKFFDPPPLDSFFDFKYLMPKLQNREMF